MMKLAVLSLFAAFPSVFGARFGLFRIEPSENHRNHVRTNEFGGSALTADAKSALRELLYMGDMSMSTSMSYSGATAWPTESPSAAPSLSPSSFPTNAPSSAPSLPPSPGTTDPPGGTAGTPTQAPTVHQFPDTAAPSGTGGAAANLDSAGRGDVGDKFKKSHKAMTGVLVVAAAAVVAALVAKKMHSANSSSSQASLSDSGGDVPQGP